MPTLPTIRGGHYAIYPVRQEDRAPVRVLKMRNGQEVRFGTSVALLRAFTLAYTNISLTDRQALDAFVASVGGQAGTTWTFQLGALGSTPTDYVNCTFIKDVFTWNQRQEYPLLWSGEIEFRQTVDVYPPTPYSPTFPNIVPQYPYQRGYEFKTAVSDLECGNRYTYQFYGAGLGNFPSGPMNTWQLDFPMLTDVQLAQIEDHWVGCNGELMPFSFIDPDDGLTYLVRYNMPSLKIQKVSPNKNSLTINLFGVYLGGTTGGGGGGGGGTGGNPVASATIFIVTQYLDNSGTGNATGYTLDTLPGSAAFGNQIQANPGPQVTTSIPLPVGTTSISGHFVTCYLWGSFGPFSGTSHMAVYDCYAVVNFANGTTATQRPSSATVHAGSDPGSTVTNPGNAIDGSGTTFATIFSDISAPLFIDPARLVMTF